MARRKNIGRINRSNGMVGDVCQHISRAAEHQHRCQYCDTKKRSRPNVYTRFTHYTASAADGCDAIVNELLFEF